MPLAPGTRFGPYEVTAQIGVGGMGEVYRATDTNLKRQVAIKILPELKATVPEGLARFQREAELLAALNHPNIARVHGIERNAATTGLVMELVEGPTLASRITQGPVPIDEAMSIARQIAEALAAAHGQGIIHRDLKPANIKVRDDGVVKVLDFGLAKAVEPSGRDTDLANSPTLTARGTEPGVILGTAAYMAPEQARGRPVDKRADLWAFGCVLFEMLSGERCFEAEDVSETLAAVLTRSPDWSRLPASTPRPIARLIKGCLERDRTKRVADVAAVLFALDEAFDEATLPESAPRTRRQTLAGWIAALVAATGFVGLWIWKPSAGQTTYLSLALPDTFTVRSFGSAALSPDASSLVFGPDGPERRELHLRRFASGEDRRLGGTGAGMLPFWSPDGRSIAFFADGLLKRIDLETEFVRTLAKVNDLPRRGSWNREGIVLYSTATGPLFKVTAEGGAVPQPATTLLPGQSSHRFAIFLPDGRRFVFLALGTADVRGLYLGALDDAQIVRLTEDASAFSFLPPDHLLIARQGALWAQRLDVRAGALVGEPRAVSSRVWVDGQWTGHAALSAAAGSIVYRAAAETRQLVWVDGTGRQIGVLGELDDSEVRPQAFSSDGSTVALRRTAGGNTDIWIMETAGGALRRISTGAAIDSEVLLSRDGRRVIYSSDPGAALWDIFERPTEGGSESVLLTTADNDVARDWSPDEQHLLLDTDGSRWGDVFAMALSGDRKPFPVVQTPAFEQLACFSPSGRWIAFETDETGRSEIYAQRFPGPGKRVPITRTGGRVPRWPRHGNELLYTDGDGRVMAVPIAERASTLEVGTPRYLFTPLPGDLYLPAPDGRRFLVSRIASPGPPLSIILNWKPPRR